MKRFAYIVAALGALVIAAPSIATAETVIIKKRGYHHHHHHPHHGARAEFRRDRGYHRGWRHGHRHKTVVIKKYRY